MARVGKGVSLVCCVGTLQCAFPVESVVETMRPLPLEPMGDLSVTEGGTAVVRGGPIAVLNVNRWFAEDGAEPQRLVIARNDDRRVGIAVDAVIDVRALDPAFLDRQPSLFDEAPTEIVAAIPADLIAVLKTSRVVPPGAIATQSATEAAAS